MIIPVILSGGSGTRLWPVSRSSFPKQFCEFFDQSLLRRTYRRLSPLGSPYVLTTEGLGVLTRKDLAAEGFSQERLVLEPFGRNTAPAVALLCREFQRAGTPADSVVGLFPADAHISRDEEFRRLVQLGAFAAHRERRVVTLGIRPTFAATGYGYIEAGEALPGSNGQVLTARGFREKPQLELAEQFVRSGQFFWNAGMFLFRLDRMVEEFQKQMPELWREMQTVGERPLQEIYQRVPSQSLDFGIMEGLRDILMVPAEVGWSDVGSWDELLDLLPAQPEGQGPVTVRSPGARVFSREDKSYGFIGVEDVELIDTADATLVVRRGQAQDVKLVLEELKRRGERRADQHPFEVRPWGRFDVLADRSEFKSKVIEVDPGQQLSYQSHDRRAEHWIILSGRGEVVLNDEILPVGPASHVYIPVKAKHRMRNTGDVPLRFVEVQLGDYFGEDDIHRYQDDYKRV